MVVTCSHVQASAHIHMSHPHKIHYDYPHPIIGPTDAGDRDRPVVAPRARTRTPDARLVHKTYMKPNAECTHGQYSFLFEQYKTAVTGSTAVRRDCVKQPIDSTTAPRSPAWQPRTRTRPTSCDEPACEPGADLASRKTSTSEKI